MKLPTTRQGCIEKYNLRRQMNLQLTKFDMYLGGMICCSNDEFLYRKPTSSGREIIGGRRPCLCICENSYHCAYMNCFDATDATLNMPWDAPLYEDALLYEDMNHE